MGGVRHLLLRPVQLRLRDTLGPAVSPGFGPSGTVPTRVAEDPARVDDERFTGRGEIGVPPRLVQYLRQYAGKLAGLGVVGPGEAEAVAAGPCLIDIAANRAGRLLHLSVLPGTPAADVADRADPRRGRRRLRAA